MRRISAIAATAALILSGIPSCGHKDTVEAAVSIDQIIITGQNPEEVSLKGTVFLSDPLDPETVSAALSFSGKENAQVTLGQDLSLSITGLSRYKSDRTMKISLKGQNLRCVSSASVLIPGTESGLRILDARNVTGDSPRIELFFTKAMDGSVADEGMVTLEGVEKAYIKANDNLVRIFYDGQTDKDLTVTVSESVSSTDGERLGKGYSRTFVHEEEKPGVSISLNGSIFPGLGKLILPFRAVCLNAVDINIIQIYENNIPMFLQDNNLNGSNDLRRSGRLVCRKTVLLDDGSGRDLHKWNDFSIDLSELLKKGDGDIYRISLTFKQEYSLWGKTSNGDAPSGHSRKPSASDEAVWNTPETYYWESKDWSRYKWEDRDDPDTPSYYIGYDYPSCNLISSDIGIIAKYSDGDKLWMAVNDIASARPLSGADIELLNFQLQSVGRSRTGPDGLAEIELKGKPFLAIASKGGVKGYLKITNGSQNDLSHFDVGGKEIEKGMKAFIYGERGVWRPGDSMHLSMILRSSGAAVPDNHPITMELYTPQGNFHSRLVCDKAENGFYCFEVPTSATDPTGLWNAYFKVGGATFHKSLRVETIKPNRLKVNLTFSSGVLESGRAARASLSSNWLTGPPASGLAVRSEMTLRPGKGGIKGFDGYCFTNPASSFESSLSKLVDCRLDAEGKAVLNLSMPSVDDAPGLLQADIVTSVTEEGGDASLSSVSIPFSPFSAYIGVKNSSGSLETDKDLVFQLAVTDKDGRRVTGHNIEYRIFKTKWSWWMESGAKELDSYVNGSASEPVASGRAVSQAVDTELPFRVDYPDWGRYFLYAKDLDSGHACGTLFTVDWPSYRGRADKSDPTDPSMLTFSLDKDAYDVGETATVYIPASAGGNALVSLENSSTVLKEEWVQTGKDGDSKYRFKITPQMAPNFYVHISLLQQPENYYGNCLPVRLYGVRPVLVNDRETHIEPQILMADTVRPEEEFEVRIKEKDGKPMTYTLAIVDDGLLDLTAFKTPDPWHEMYSREALGVKTWDLYDDVINSWGGRMSLRVGGDGENISSSKKENRFNPVVKFLGPFTLSKGSAKHKITLPMYVGSVRVMVVAGYGKAFGNAQKTVTVKAPLMILPTLPRVLAPGESVTLPVNVFAMENGIGKVDVSVRCEGPLAIEGRSSDTLSFENTGDKLARFRLRSTGEGTAKVIVSASGGGQRSHDSISIVVRNPNPPVSSVSSILIDGSEAGSFTYHPVNTAKGGYARLGLSSFPSIDFSSCFTRYENYEYSCSEQLSAKGLAYIYSKSLVDNTSQALIDKDIPLIIKELYSRQLSDGGFAYWPGDTGADTWVSSMAGQFLTEASARGYEVDKSVMKDWQSFQDNCIKNYLHSGSVFLNDLDQAYRLYTLVIAGSADNASMNRLRESDGLSLQARLMLASAYAMDGKASVAQGMTAETDGTIGDYCLTDRTFGSPLRDKAIAVNAYCLSDETGKALTLAQDIAEEVNSGYANTQELAFAAMAMSRLAEKTGTGSVSAAVDGKKIQSGTSLVTAELDNPSGSTEVRNLSRGKLYATLLTVRVPEAGEKVKPASSSLSVRLLYTGDNGAAVNPSSVRQGDNFTATVTVSNPSLSQDLTNLALTLRIPSGWEISNERLFTAVAAQNSFDYNDIRDDRSIWYFSLPRGTSKTFKLRLRAAYEGVFVLPAAKCEAMYDARVFASTASGTAVVHK